MGMNVQKPMQQTMVHGDDSDTINNHLICQYVNQSIYQLGFNNISFYVVCRKLTHNRI